LRNILTVITETQLLGIILERVTEQTVAKYSEEKIWIPMGAEFDASWSLGSAEEGFEKMESGVNARSIDFAKIGSIFLNNGMWNGMQIVSSKWVSESTSPSFFNVRGWGNNRYFGYKWWGILRGNNKIYYAPGHLGQYIYVNPDKKIVVVRNGKGYGGLYRHKWITLIDNLVNEISKDSYP
jgi:CubicO group peptidase (beta-lactamase class C family)